ncbi:MAG: hypothetical protein KC800_01025 [Candidatus Eremiobacteraeota bacterium]|nr:hypothetical protein [Candidatus Eremiobacteraeota bacterium]
MGPEVALVGVAVAGMFAGIILLARNLRPSRRYWKKLAARYGADPDLSGCHNQDGIWMGTPGTSTEGQARVGATLDGLVLKPYDLPTVCIPWEQLFIEDHQGETYATLRVRTGEVPSLGIKRKIFDSIIQALESTEAAPRIVHLKRPQ